MADMVILLSVACCGRRVAEDAVLLSSLNLLDFLCLRKVIFYDLKLGGAKISPRDVSNLKMHLKSTT